MRKMRWNYWLHWPAGQSLNVKRERERVGGKILLRVRLRPVCPACPREAELLEIPSVEEVTVPPSPAPSPPPPGLPEIWGRWDGRLARRLCRADTGM